MEHSKLGSWLWTSGQVHWDWITAREHCSRQAAYQKLPASCHSDINLIFKTCGWLEPGLTHSILNSLGETIDMLPHWCT